MSIGTGTSGTDQAGDVFVYAPPGVTMVDRGTAIVTYGPEVTLQPGEAFPSVGIFEITAGSVSADNLVFIRTVTIT